MMRRISVSLAVVVIGVVAASDHRAVEAQGTGMIVGRVVLTGQAPGNPIIRMGIDPMCAKANNGQRPVNGIVLRDAKGGLANAFVDVEGTFKAPPATGVVELAQQNCVYTPRVIGARVGQTLRIVNHDMLAHNVHSHSAKSGNNFNFTQPTAGLTRDIVLKDAEQMMRVGCDIHSWMVSYVGVETHPYFSVTGTDGSFRIAGVPPGTYPVRVWHERFGRLTQTVTVTAAKPATVTFSFTGAEKPAAALRQLLPASPFTTNGPEPDRIPAA